MEKRHWTLTLAAVLLSACAATPGGFDRLDANRDGYLNAVEGEGDDAVQGQWHALDRDRDGRVSAAEFSALERRLAGTAR